MSPKRARCKVKRVLYEAKQSTLHQEPKRVRHTTFNPYLQEYVTKRIRKRAHLQTVLSNEPDKYDDKWFWRLHGDCHEKEFEIMASCNCNGLLYKGDIREFQFDVANIADNGVSYILFTETCVNSSKLDYHTKLIDAYKSVIPTGGMRFANLPSYP